jgi:hypothetical protein
VRGVYRFSKNQGAALIFKAYWLRDAPTGLTFDNYTLSSHCIYVFCIYFRTNNDLCHLRHKLISFYNREEKCLQRDMGWVFKSSSLRLVFKGLINVAGYWSLISACLFQISVLP